MHSSPISKASEDYSNSILNLTITEQNEIQASETRNEILFSSWNVHDGAVFFRQAIVKELLTALPSQIIFLQELTATPHKQYSTYGLGTKESTSSDAFISRFGNSFENKRSQVMKDPSGGYLATFIDHLQFEFADIPEEIILTRDRVVNETYRAKALLSVVRDKINMNQKCIVLINVHSPRGERSFNESILKLVSEIPQEYHVIFAGDFNDNLWVDYPLFLNVVLCGTNEDQLRKKNIDFVGSRSGIRLADVVLYNSSKDFKELITRTFWNRIFHQINSYFNSTVLNHPIIRGYVMYEDE